MFECYDAKPWLRIGVGYVAGRLSRAPWDTGERVVFGDWLAENDGFAECLCCPEIGLKSFRRRHTLARFLRQHRHCGKARATFQAGPDSSLAVKIANSERT
jgi:hypothetical protein